MTVFLFYGQEEYLMEKEIKKLRSELLDASFMSMSFKIFDNPPFEDLLSCIQSAPLMFGNTLSIINLDKYLLGNSSFDDKQIEALDFALKNINDATNIIFVGKVSREKYKKPDTRKKLYKTISKYAQVREFVQYATYSKELPPIIINMAKEKDLTISTNSTNVLIEQLGSNLVLIDSELEKLKINIHPNKTITDSDIKKYCFSTEDVFMLADLIVQGNKNEILKQYNQLLEKKLPVEILGALQNNLAFYVFVKYHEKKLSPQEIGARQNKHEFVIKKTIEKLQSISLKKLIEVKEEVTKAEYKIKSGQTIDGETILELAMLS